MPWTLIPARMLLFLSMIASVALMSALDASAGPVDGISELSDDWDMTVTDMAVVGDEVYLVATREEVDCNSVHFRYHDGDRWFPWRWVSGFRYRSAGHAAIAVENGTVHVVYYAHIDQEKTGIFHRAFHNFEWSPETRVDLDSGNWEEHRITPDVAVDGGVIHVVWNQMMATDRGIHYRRMDQGGWGEVEVVGPSDYGVSLSSPKVVADGANVHVAWVHTHGTMAVGYVDYRHHDGSNWSESLKVGAGIEVGAVPSRFDMVLYDGVVHFAWSTRKGNYASVYHVSVDDGVLGDAQRVSPDMENGTFHTPSIAVEGDGIAVVWMSGRWYGNTTVALRYFNGTAWGTHQTLGANLGSDKQSTPLVSIDMGRLHVAWNGEDNGTYTILYWCTTLESGPPTSLVGPLDVFWVDPEGLEVPWSAEDDYFLGRVSLYYRFSEDNMTWPEWTRVQETTRVTSPTAEGTFAFVPGDGDGFYQFRTSAEDLLGNVEALSAGPEATVALDTVAPTGSISIVGDPGGVTSIPELRLALTYNDEMTGILENATGSALLMMNVTQQALDGNPTWTSVEPEMDLTLLGWDGTKTISLQVRDLAGHASPVYSVHIVLDTAPPHGTVQIAGGAHRIASSEVQLDITYVDATSGAVSLRLSNDGIWDDEAWRPLETPLLWNLGDGEGLRSVYLQVIDRAGWTSKTVADHVVVDLEAPVGNVTIITTAGYTASLHVNLRLEYHDNLSDVTRMRLGNNGSWGEGDWREPSGLVGWSLDDRSGSHTVYLQLMDEWGHISETFQDEIVVDLDRPRASVTIVDGEKGVNSLDLELVISFSDKTSRIERMRLSDRDDFKEVPWEEPSEARVFTLTPGDGWRSVYVQVMDSVGHVSWGQWDDVFVDATPPAVVTTSPLPDETQVWPYGEIFISFNEPMDKASVEGHLHLTTGAWEIVSSITWSNDGTTIFVSPHQPLEEGRLYRLALGTGATDALGNSLAAPLAIEFETQDGAHTEAPTGEGADMIDVMMLLIAIAIAVNVAMAVLLVRTRRRPRRPDAGGVS